MVPVGTRFGILVQMSAFATARLAEIGAITARMWNGATCWSRWIKTSSCGACRPGQVTVIDVRPTAEFEADHLSGGISMPLDELDGRPQELPRDRAVVAYCLGPYCVMSFDATALVRARGFTAHRLEVGVVEWRTRSRRRRAMTGLTRAKRAASPASKRSARVAGSI